MTLERELRDTSDSLMRALERLGDMESEKRTLPTGTPRFVELAQRVEELALVVLRRTEKQTSLAETMGERHDAGGGTGIPINAIAPEPRELAIILSEWRDAERALVAADPASTDALTAASNVRRLREEYRVAREAVASDMDRGART